MTYTEYLSNVSGVVWYLDIVEHLRYVWYGKREYEGNMMGRIEESEVVK